MQFVGWPGSASLKVLMELRWVKSTAFQKGFLSEIRKGILAVKAKVNGRLLQSGDFVHFNIVGKFDSRHGDLLLDIQYWRDVVSDRAFAKTLRPSSEDTEFTRFNLRRESSPCCSEGLEALGVPFFFRILLQGAIVFGIEEYAYGNLDEMQGRKGFKTKVSSKSSCKVTQAASDCEVAAKIRSVLPRFRPSFAFLA
jgi:hypothetical protein